MIATGKIATLRDRLSRLSNASLRLNGSLDLDEFLQGVLDGARILISPDQRCPSKQIRTKVLESAVRESVEEVLTQPDVAIEMAERLHNSTDHGARLAELEREIARVAVGEGRLVDLYTDGQIAKDVLDVKHEPSCGARARSSASWHNCVRSQSPGRIPRCSASACPRCSRSSASGSGRPTVTTSNC